MSHILGWIQINNTIRIGTTSIHMNIGIEAKRGQIRRQTVVLSYILFLLGLFHAALQNQPSSLQKERGVIAELVFPFPFTSLSLL